MDIKCKIPKVLFQTSLKKPPEHVVSMIKEKTPGWDYLFFSDDDIIDYFTSNPVADFPDIVNKFYSFSNGAHRADLFRYYFLYLNGGVFLDSDAMLEEDIHSIVRDYEFVSVNSYHNNKQLIFNGFIGTVEKSPILYSALLNLYGTDDSKLKQDYHWVCKDLFDILVDSGQANIMIFQEKKLKLFRAGVITFNDKRVILKHYCYTKIIPDYSCKWKNRVYRFIYRYVFLYSGYKMYLIIRKRFRSFFS